MFLSGRLPPATIAVISKDFVCTSVFCRWLRSSSSNLLGGGSARSGPFGLPTSARYAMLIWSRSGDGKLGPAGLARLVP